MYQQEKRNSEAFSLFFCAFLSEDKTPINSVVSRVHAIYKKEKWRSLLSFLKRHFLPPPTSSPAPRWINSPTPKPQWIFIKQTQNHGTQSFIITKDKPIKKQKMDNLLYFRKIIKDGIRIRTP